MNVFMTDAVIIGKISKILPSAFSSILSIKRWFCSTKTSKNCSRILKWNVGVMIRRRVNHFWFVLNSKPSPILSCIISYWDPLEINLLLVRMTSRYFGSSTIISKLFPSHVRWINFPDFRLFSNFFFKNPYISEKIFLSYLTLFKNSFNWSCFFDIVVNT